MAVRIKKLDLVILLLLIVFLPDRSLLASEFGKDPLELCAIHLRQVSTALTKIEPKKPLLKRITGIFRREPEVEVPPFVHPELIPLLDAYETFLSMKREDGKKISSDWLARRAFHLVRWNREWGNEGPGLDLTREQMTALKFIAENDPVDGARLAAQQILSDPPSSDRYHRAQEKKLLDRHKQWSMVFPDLGFFGADDIRTRKQVLKSFARSALRMTVKLETALKSIAEKDENLEVQELAKEILASPSRAVARIWFGNFVLNSKHLQIFDSLEKNWPNWSPEEMSLLQILKLHQVEAFSKRANEMLARLALPYR